MWTTLEKLLLKFPNANWNWEHVQYNDCLTWKFIYAHLDFHPWDWDIISSKKDITIDIVKKNTTVTWVWWRLSRNKGIKMEDIQNNLHLPWCWLSIACNPNLTWDFVVENFDQEFDWTYLVKFLPVDKILASEPELNNRDAQLREKLLSNGEWGVLDNETLTYDNLKKYPNKKWNNECFWIATCKEKIETFLGPESRPFSVEKILSNLPERMRDTGPYFTSWFFTLMSDHPKVNISYIKAYPSDYWDWSTLSMKIPFRDIISNPQCKWDYKYLYYNPTVRYNDYTRQILRTPCSREPKASARLSFPLISRIGLHCRLTTVGDTYRISKKENRTLISENNDWSCNPNITFKNVVNGSGWNFLLLSTNRFSENSVVKKRLAQKFARKKRRLTGLNFM